MTEARRSITARRSGGRTGATACDLSAAEREVHGRDISHSDDVRVDGVVIERDAADASPVAGLCALGDPLSIVS